VTCVSHSLTPRVYACKQLFTFCVYGCVARLWFAFVCVGNLVSSSLSLYPPSLSPHSASAWCVLSGMSGVADKVPEFRSLTRDLNLSSLVVELPLLSLGASSRRIYARSAADYLSCCAAVGVAPLPPTYNSVMSFLLAIFVRGVKPVSMPSIISRVKFFTTSVAGAKWLPSKDLTLLRAGRRALEKLVVHRVVKSTPLYKSTLRFVDASLRDRDVKDRMFLSLWAMAQACMQRLGEAVLGVRANVGHFQPQSKSPFFIFSYLHSNRPKAHKTKVAPYAMVSLANNPLAYRCLQWLLENVVGPEKSAFLFPVISADSSIDRSRRTSARVAILWLRHAVSGARLPGGATYGATSARRGGLSDALAAGVPLQYCEAQGHWAPTSSTPVREYEAQSWSRRLQYF
jgi:hypothetical protein